MSTQNSKKPWKYSKVGSIVGSFDFYLGVPLAFFACSIFAFSTAARSNEALILLGSAGLAAAVTTLVVGNMTLLLSLFTKEYISIISNLPSGFDGVVRPYLIVIKVAALGVATSLVGAMFSPSVENLFVVHSMKLLGFTVEFHIGSWLIAVLGIAFAFWSTFGCIQLVEQLIFHWKSKDTFEKISSSHLSLAKKNVG